MKAGIPAFFILYNKSGLIFVYYLMKIKSYEKNTDLNYTYFSF